MIGLAEARRSDRKQYNAYPQVILAKTLKATQRGPWHALLKPMTWTDYEVRRSFETCAATQERFCDCVVALDYLSVRPK